MSDKPARWTARAMSAVVMVLAVAVGARVTWMLLAPLVPILGVIVTLGVVYAIAFGRLRR